MTAWDWWRSFNSAGALIAFCYACYWTRNQWVNFIPSERVRWLSFDALLFAAFYAPFEIVFFPNIQARVPILTIAIVWAQVSLMLSPRFPKEEYRGQQSRVSRTRTPPRRPR